MRRARAQRGGNRGPLDAIQSKRRTELIERDNLAAAELTASAPKPRAGEPRPAAPRAEQGEPGKAHDLLAPIHGRFTERFDTPELKDARARLEQLA